MRLSDIKDKTGKNKKLKDFSDDPFMNMTYDELIELDYIDENDEYKE